MVKTQEQSCNSIFPVTTLAMICKFVSAACSLFKLARFEVSTEKCIQFVTPCSLICGYQPLGGTRCLHCRVKLVG